MAKPLLPDKKKLVDYSAVGLMFPSSILVGFVIGHFLDKWFKTDPVLTIIFILYGILAGFVNLFAVSRSHEKNK